MVSKCANPQCSVPFRYLHTGKLFRVETATGLERRRTMGQDDEQHKALRRLEFFWLCGHCAEKLTLIFDKASGVTVQAKEPISDYACSAAA
ncbi:MAG TPA: hypothetical protein VFA90_11855 [Terriglobales bacterium]|nr:hypothetical protein [Terriglobales bacterium]